MLRNLFCFVLIVFFFSSCAKNSSDLKRNYDENSKDIKELKEYFNKIVPKGYIVTIRYGSSDEVDLKVYEPTDVPSKIALLFRQWDIDFEDYLEPEKLEYEKKDYDPKTNSLALVKKKLKWNNDTFNELYEKLENANCIGITNGNPTEVEYGYRGMGVMNYLLFDNNLTEEEQKENSNDCSKMFYKDNIVFTFSPGGIGSFCIPDFKRTKK